VSPDDAGRAAGTVARALWKMARPSQLLLVSAVYALGAVVAGARAGPLDADSLLRGLAPLVPVAASVHYANEYADRETDALTERTPFSGGSGALPATGLDRSVALGAGLAALALGTAAALAFFDAIAPAGGLLLAVVAAFGWQYSVGPLALAWRGWGELDNALLGGLVLPLYGFAVQTGGVSLPAVAFFLPLTAAVFVNLLATTWPDREADAAVGKRTLATRWSRTALRRTYAAGLAVGVGSLGVGVAHGLPIRLAAAHVAVAPLFAWGYRDYTRRESPLPTVLAMVAVVALELVLWGSYVETVAPVPFALLAP